MSDKAYTKYDSEVISKFGHLAKEKMADIVPFNDILPLQPVEKSKDWIKLSMPIRYKDISEDFYNFKLTKDKSIMAYCSFLIDYNDVEHIKKMTCLNYSKIVFKKVDFNVFNNLMNRNLSIYDRLTARHFVNTEIKLNFKIDTIDDLAKGLKITLETCKKNHENLLNLINNEGLIRYYDIVNKRKAELRQLEKQIDFLRAENNRDLEKISKIFKKNIDILTDID